MVAYNRCLQISFIVVQLCFIVRALNTAFDHYIYMYIVVACMASFDECVCAYTVYVIGCVQVDRRADIILL